MRTWKRVAGITLGGAAIVAATLGIGVVYIGVYDVSATSQHTVAAYQFLEIALRRSVKQRVKDMEIPPLESDDRVVNGFKLFRAHCVQCHGAPGIAPQPFALGLNPAPASLVATAQEWPAAEVYWVIRHGIKMSGMPAWRYRMSDKEIWDVVAFMKILPTLSTADYATRNTQDDQIPIKTTESSRVSSKEDALLGDAVAGGKALQQYLCATCHVIPGVVGARHHVGPDLTGIADRQYIAGVLPNTAANMVHWLRNPAEVDPLTTMPDLGVSEQDARDIAAFLYSLHDIE